MTCMCLFIENANDLKQSNIFLNTSIELSRHWGRWWWLYWLNVYVCVWCDVRTSKDTHKHKLVQKYFLFYMEESIGIEILFCYIISLYYVKWWRIRNKMLGSNSFYRVVLKELICTGIWLSVWGINYLLMILERELFGKNLKV